MNKYFHFRSNLYQILELCPSHLNLEMEPLRIAVFPETPFPIDRTLTPILQDLQQLSGIPFSFLNGRELSANSTAIPPNLNNYDSCIQLMVENKVDLCPQLLTVTEKRLEKVDFLAPYLFHSTKVAYIISKTGFDYDAVDYLAVSRVFDWGLWAGIFGSVVVFPVVCWMVGREEGYWGYWEQVFGLVVMQGREARRKREYFLVAIHRFRFLSSRNHLHQHPHHPLGVHRLHPRSLLQRRAHFRHPNATRISAPIRRHTDDVFRRFRIRYPAGSLRR